ncbi:copia protein [Tanacetum coccineum]
MRRADQQLYEFKEGDFVNLHLNDIEDMLLLVVQHKLFHLNGEVIVDLPVTLRMFTRSLIIKKRVEDVQLGVESYQKKLNITKPQKDFLGIFAKELYTPSFDPPGVVYAFSSNQKRLMRADELYKFSDGTLKKICDTLHYKLLNFSDAGEADHYESGKIGGCKGTRDGLQADAEDNNHTWTLTQLPTGIDYKETYAPVAKMVTVRTLLALSVSQGCHIEQLNIDNAFLHRDLNEKVYMIAP